MNPHFTMEYRPLYFLSALGNGGLSISFFVYLLFLVPHRGEPIPNFEHIAAAFASGTLVTRSLLVLALVFVAFFAARHFQLLAATWSPTGGSAARRPTRASPEATRRSPSWRSR